MPDSYDYIIAGAGTAGCVLAERLSADPDVTVLLLEAGRDDSPMRVRIPLAARSMWHNPSYNWGYQSEPEPNADNRRIAVPRGKLLGGSSSINGMLYVRGHPRDFDQWRQLGAAGWSYQDVLPVYKRLERHWAGETEHHGAAGPVQIVQNPLNRDLVAPLREAAERAGAGWTDDYNGPAPDGYAIPEQNIARGRRAGASQVFLAPARSRANLTVETFAQATRVVIENGRATALDYVRRGDNKTANAAREILLCGGVYNSPQLLMLSGIGPADELRRHGIAVIHDLPGVGRNLQDHAGVGVDVALSQPLGFVPQLRMDRLALSMVRWALTGTGPAAGAPIICTGFIHTREGLERPDIQTLFTTVHPLAWPWFPGIRKPTPHMFGTRSVLLHPESRGTVTLASADPLAKPAIRFNLLSTETDRAALREAVRHARAVFESEPIRSMWKAETAPGRHIESDADIDAYIRRTVTTAFHGVGTCAIGDGDQSVVDPALRVRGIDGLRVADSSVMPTITGGNTHAPALMIGAKAADIILGTPA